MAPPVQRCVIDGGAGRIEMSLDWPADAPPRGLVVIGHPHPLFGGTSDNKVVTTISRAFTALGWLAVRPNFRGVGATSGTHDEGRGETEDFLYVVAAVPPLAAPRATLAADAPLALAGFSFGSFVAARAAIALSDRVSMMVLVGAAAAKWPMPDVPAQTLVIHGERDDTIPLADVLDWARPQELPVVVVPGADHFFHRRLGVLKRLISTHIRGMPAIDAVAQTD